MSAPAIITAKTLRIVGLKPNSDEGKFEGVTTGTYFEPMATEGFGIALAVALGW